MVESVGIHDIFTDDSRRQVDLVHLPSTDALLDEFDLLDIARFGSTYRPMRNSARARGRGCVVAHLARSEHPEPHEWRRGACARSHDERFVERGSGVVRDEPTDPVALT